MAPRKSFTVQEKLRIIELKKKSNLQNRKFAASVGINESMIRRWLKDEDKFKSQPVLVRRMRKLPRARIGHHLDLEKEVLKWVQDRNSTTFDDARR